MKCVQLFWTAYHRAITRNCTSGFEQLLILCAAISASDSQGVTECAFTLTASGKDETELLWPNQTITSAKASSTIVSTKIVRYKELYKWLLRQTENLLLSDVTIENEHVTVSIISDSTLTTDSMIEHILESDQKNVRKTWEQQSKTALRRAFERVLRADWERRVKEIRNNRDKEREALNVQYVQACRHRLI